MDQTVDIKTINLNGQLIRVAIRAGRINSTPLLMCNGIGASLELVLPFIKALHPDQTVIAFDVPGVGGSPVPLMPYRFSGLARTVAQMLDALNFGQVDVLGLSWGGFLAQQFAHDYPQRCRKLILAATSAGLYSIPPSAKVLSLMASPRRYTDPEYAASIAPEIYGGRFRTDPALAAAHAKKMADCKAETKTDWTGTLGYYYQIGAVYWWTSYHFLRKIAQPTLVLAGSDDPLIPLVNMRTLANRIPNAELHVFDDGHLFLLTALDEVLPIITDFLDNAVAYPEITKGKLPRVCAAA